MVSDFDCNMMLANDLIIGCETDIMICGFQKSSVSPLMGSMDCAPRSVKVD